ncbi:hypothetical protein ACM25N_08865 [Roseovarius sp. C7]|uniref:hypothetical protein n=1 Tax=Roseovarius sp. C7 TaxID=3398643 RepID=UPI0039F73FED
MQTVFFGASFSAQQFHVLSEVVALGFLAVPFQGVVLLCGTAFVSYGRTMTLVRVATLMVGVLTGLGLVFQAQWGVKGLMGAYVLVQLLGASLLTWRLVTLVGGEVIKKALDHFVTSLALPIALCLAIGWGGRQLDLPAIVVLLISGIVFISIHLWSDPKLLHVIRRSKTS